MFMSRKAQFNAKCTPLALQCILIAVDCLLKTGLGVLSKLQHYILLFYLAHMYLLTCHSQGGG